MKSVGTIHVKKCLQRITDKYDLDAVSLKRVKDLSPYIITSIAFTTDGGFDEATGNFHCEDKKVNFKVRIKFKKDEGQEEEFLVLKPISIATSHFPSRKVKIH